MEREIILEKKDLEDLKISTQSQFDDYALAINGKRIKQGKPIIEIRTDVKLPGESRLMLDYMNAKSTKQ